MKKVKIIIPVVLICLIGIIGLYVWNNRIVSTVTIDINPSFKISLNRKNRVVSVKALNNDAKLFIKDDFKNVSLEDTITVLADNVIESPLATDELVILISATGKVKNEDVKTTLSKNFENQNVEYYIIAVDNITKADEKLAKQNNITPAKAAYINSIVKENDDIEIKALFDKSISELKETQDTGLYCDTGYQREGTNCLKEISRVKANSGMVCPTGYFEYNGKCYEETGVIDTDEKFCTSEFNLTGEDCYRKLVSDAIPSKYSCSKGEAKTRLELGLSSANDGDANEVTCVDLSNATHPVSPCELPASDPTERKMIGGKCYWHRAPVIATGCPGKIKVAGECWDDASNVLICAGYRDGKQYKSRTEYCEHSIKYIKPTVTEYKCEEDFTLKGNKCEKEESFPAPHKRICPAGYTIIDNSNCINLNKTTYKVGGFVCEGDNTRLVNKDCVAYEIVDAKGK